MTFATWQHQPNQNYIGCLLEQQLQRELNLAWCKVCVRSRDLTGALDDPGPELLTAPGELNVREVPDGVLKLTLLKALKTSVRNCNLSWSLIGNSLNNEMPTDYCDGPKNWFGSFLPRVPCVGWKKEL